MNRRKFVRGSLFSLGGFYLTANFISCKHDPAVSPDVIPKNLDEKGFEQGVGSFDPTQDQVIIWTRYAESGSSVKINWELAYDSDFSEIVRKGTVETGAARDYTVAIEVKNLEAGKTFYYRFANLEKKQVSAVGQTITLPNNPMQLKLGICSCSNFAAGFFNVYKAMAESDVDVVVHLGDYIYEYGQGEYGTNQYTKVNNREHQPAHETVSLSDYRRRYVQHRSDENLKKAHQLKPFICVWDDHEIANDAYKSGAENHQANEGSWEVRKKAAIQAYSEYLPVKTDDSKLIYRNFTCGNLLNLVMLDTRVVGRNKQLDYADYFDKQGNFNAPKFQASWMDTQRTILGETQRSWLIKQVSGSSAKWQVLGQQVLMAKMLVPAEMLGVMAKIQAEIKAKGSVSPATFAQLRKSLTELVQLKMRLQAGDPSLTKTELARVKTVLPYNLDAWDGYPAERELLYKAFGGKKVISLAGDTHNGWHSSLKPLQGKTEVGTEFACASVSSPGLEAYLGTTPQAIQGFQQAMNILIDDLSYLNAAQRGYVKVTFNQSAAHAEWIYADTVFSKTFNMTTDYNTSYSG